MSRFIPIISECLILFAGVLVTARGVEEHSALSILAGALMLSAYAIMQEVKR